ncbi:MAG: TetR/AcrR family transcriptional regulator [Lachnospirales bacterium]
MSKNKQLQKSKKWIIDALYKLMSIKPYNSITIKEIAEKAGVSRLTFYRNFESKENILEINFQNMFSIFLEEIENSNIIDVRDLLVIIFKQWDKNRSHLEALIDNHLENILYKPFVGYLDILFDKFNIDYKIDIIQKHFLAGGLFFSMIEWVKYTNKTPEEMADLILEIMKISHNSID